MSISVALTSRFGGFALNARFEAPPGITALFGPSGAGKTLTLRCIAGLTTPAEGHIAIDGRVLFDQLEGVDVPARLRRVGYVFQQYALFPHLDVANNVAFALQGVERSQPLQRVTELLQLVGLSGYERRRPRDLSGGEQQRVALARALAHRPRILLLDEPFAALDFRIRRRLRGELRQVHRATSTPMLLVTHDLAEVRQLADWLVLYDDGRVLRSGPTAEVLADPGHEDAAELLQGDLA